MGKDKHYLKNVFLSLFVTTFIALVFSISWFQTRDVYYGELYSIDASCQDAVDTFFNLRDSLSEIAVNSDRLNSYENRSNRLIDDDSINGIDYSAYMDSVRNDAIKQLYSYTNTFNIYLPIVFKGEKIWVKILIYSDDANKTIVQLCSIGSNDVFSFDFTYVNSNSLGFINSYKISRAFEQQVLNRSGLKWRDTTPIGYRLGPLYLWVYHIWGREARLKY